MELNWDKNKDKNQIENKTMVFDITCDTTTVTSHCHTLSLLHDMTSAWHMTKLHFQTKCLNFLKNSSTNIWHIFDPIPSFVFAKYEPNWDV